MIGLARSFCLLVVFFFTVPPQASASAETHNNNLIPFNTGDKIILECQTGFENGTITWGPAITCMENGEPLAFEFGVDKFFYCGWLIADFDTFYRAQRIIKQEQAWMCRIPLSRDQKNIFLPLNLNLWGIVEPSHFHVNNHLNFIFHVEENENKQGPSGSGPGSGSGSGSFSGSGRIIGVSIYPVRDRFQFVKPGSVISLHGPVRWFVGHSFISSSGAAGSGSTGNVGHSHNHAHGIGIPSSNLLDSLVSVMTIFLTVVFSVTITLILGTLFYSYRLKPHLINKYLKKD